MNASKHKRTVEEFHLAFLEQLKEETPIDLLKTQEYEKLCVYLREKIQTRIIEELGELFNQKLLKKHWIDRWLVKLSNNGPVYLDVCQQAANLVYLNLLRKPEDTILWLFLICFLTQQVLHEFLKDYQIYF